MVDLRKLVDGTTKNIPPRECQDWRPPSNIQFQDLDKLIGRLGHRKKTIQAVAEFYFYSSFWCQIHYLLKSVFRDEICARSAQKPTCNKEWDTGAPLFMKENDRYSYFFTFLSEAKCLM